MSHTANHHIKTTPHGWYCMECDARNSDLVPEVERLRAERDGVRETALMLRRALVLVLPMAKAWAAEHDVDSNQDYVELASEIAGSTAGHSSAPEDSK